MSLFEKDPAWMEELHEAWVVLNTVISIPTWCILYWHYISWHLMKWWCGQLTFILTHLWEGKFNSLGILVCICVKSFVCSLMIYTHSAKRSQNCLPNCPTLTPPSFHSRLGNPPKTLLFSLLVPYIYIYTLLILGFLDEYKDLRMLG